MSISIKQSSSRNTQKALRTNVLKNYRRTIEQMYSAFHYDWIRPMITFFGSLGAIQITKLYCIVLEYLPDLESNIPHVLNNVYLYYGICISTCHLQPPNTFQMNTPY